MPRVGDVVEASPSKLVNWGDGHPIYGIVTSMDIVYGAGSMIPMPTWVVMWSGNGGKIKHHLEEFTLDWIESGYITRVTCKMQQTKV